MKNHNFFYDVNFLRAFAVVLVLLYHLPLINFDAGFFGVDVFFVISGFLMSHIGFREAKSKSFSASKFFFRRLARLMNPALFLVTVFFSIGYVLFPIGDLISLLKEISFLLFGISNIHYGLSGNYFSQGYEFFFLHSWSLSVELQLYLFFAIIFSIFLSKSTGQWALLLGLVFLSFCAMLFANTVTPTLSFYLSPLRAWEFLVGCLAFFSTKNLSLGRLARAFSLAFSIALFSISLSFESSNWPSFQTLLPVLASFFFILANSYFSVYRSRIFMYLGSRSYSLYLWHWPLIVLFSFYELNSTEGVFLTILLISLILIFSEISYRFFEQGYSNFSSRRYFLITFCFGSAFICATFFPTLLPRFVPNHVEKISLETLNVDSRRDICTPVLQPFGLPLCQYGEGHELGAILIGDSYAAMYAPTLGRIASNEDQHIKLLAHNGCLPLKGVLMKTNQEKCSEFTIRAFDYLSEVDISVPIIFSTANYFSSSGNSKNKFTLDKFDSAQYFREDSYSARLATLLCNAFVDRTVYIVKPIPILLDGHPSIHLRDWFLSPPLDTEITTSKHHYESDNQQILESVDLASQQCEFIPIDPAGSLCSDGACKIFVKGRTIYSDHSHLSLYGADAVGSNFKLVFDR